jgi:hypothetical protein
MYREIEPMLEPHCSKWDDYEDEEWIRKEELEDDLAMEAYYDTYE